MSDLLEMTYIEPDKWTTKDSRVVGHWTIEQRAVGLWFLVVIPYEVDGQPAVWTDVDGVDTTCHRADLPITTPEHPTNP